VRGGGWVLTTVDFSGGTLWKKEERNISYYGGGGGGKHNKNLEKSPRKVDQKVRSVEQRSNKLDLFGENIGIIKRQRSLDRPPKEWKKKKEDPCSVAKILKRSFRRGEKEGVLPRSACRGKVTTVMRGDNSSNAMCEHQQVRKKKALERKKIRRGVCLYPKGGLLGRNGNSILPQDDSGRLAQ